LAVSLLILHVAPCRASRRAITTSAPQISLIFFAFFASFELFELATPTRRDAALFL